MRTRSLAPLAALLCATLSPTVRAAAPNTIGFQGVLKNGAGRLITSPGTSVVFSLYTAATGGTAVWTETQPLPVAGGLFSALLGSVTSFASANVVFDKPYWVGVKVAGEGAEMTPRVPLQSVPYALGAWNLGGNSGTNPANDWLGTSDAQPVVLKANGHRVAQYQDVVVAGSTTHSVNILAGAENNAIAAGVVGSVIAGGGNSGYINDLHGDYSVIGGGNGNFTDTVPYVTVAGGYNNIGQGTQSFIGGGTGNNTQGTSSVISGGSANYAGGKQAAITGGIGNQANGDQSAVGGGESNTAGGMDATVGGGGTNTAGGTQSTIGGGAGNSAAGQYNTVSGGYSNKTSDYATTIGGGVGNTATYYYATVPGGALNTATAQASVIAGGRENHNGGWYAAIGGGYQNYVYDYPLSNYATIGGGFQNIARKDYAAIGGGSKNDTAGTYAVIPGGYFNQATGTAAFAAGYRAVANLDGSFVWSDYSAEQDFNAPAANQFCVRAKNGIVVESFGNVSIYTGVGGAEANRYLQLLNSPAAASASGLKAGGILCADNFNYANPGKNDMVVKGTLGVGYPNPSPYTFAVNGSVYALNGYASSDRRLKSNIETLGNALDDVEALRGVTFDWNKAAAPDRNFPNGRQVGLIAQEVEAVLPELVSEDGQGFKAVNYQGVVPVLVEAVKTLKSQNDALAAKNAALEARLDTLARAVAQLQHGRR